MTERLECDTLLELAEPALSPLCEEVCDRGAHARLDLAVEVDEGPAEPQRHLRAEPGLPRAHEPREGDVAAERVQVRGRHRSPIRAR